MIKKKDTRFDIMVIGSGFAGSLLSIILKKQGKSVVLVEQGTHPRFSIGESSTPIADMILRSLAKKYNVSFLNKLSRYGSWIDHYPELLCGLKRGFSYYFHDKGKFFYTDKQHSNELLVAASSSNLESDTQWYRPDLDMFFVNKAIETGVHYVDKTAVHSCEREFDNLWKISLEGMLTDEVTASYIIDATGSPDFSIRYLKSKPSTIDFKTISFAVYSHFSGVKYWQDYLQENAFNTNDYPFHTDHAALHHLIDVGWLWMLRFRNDVLSAGFLIDPTDDDSPFDSTAEDLWNNTLSKYPSLLSLFQHSKLASSPGKIIKSGRLQRMNEHAFGDGWVCLPHSVGFIDPLHSTGIAFALTGVERLASIFEPDDTSFLNIKSMLQLYQSNLHKELILIDYLVSGCYLSRKQPQVFQAWLMWYFVCSINYEQARQSGEIPKSFLMADDTHLFQLIQQSYTELTKLKADDFPDDDCATFIQNVKLLIKPYNNVGLLDSQNRNMYHHTAVNLLDK